MGVWDDLAKPETHVRLLLHPMQSAVRDTITRLIGELRDVTDISQLRSVQMHLLEALVEAERLYGEQSRLAKRGEGDPIDLIFWRRAVSQLRTIGDGIAWRFLGYRRQWIFLMGQNEPPGMWSDKAGANAEWDLFNRHWDAGEPTLLTGLTACIRLGDLLVASETQLMVYEVKTDPKRFGGKQRRALEQLVRQVNAEPRISKPDGDTWILESEVSFSSYWSLASDELRRATNGGLATWVPTPGVALLITVGRYTDMRSPEAVAERLAAAQAEAAEKMGEVTRRIVTHTHIRPWSVARAAPPTIYPIDAELAALIVSGEMLMTIEVSVDQLVERLAAEGLRAEIVLPEEHSSLTSTDGVLRWEARDGGRGLLHAGVMNELALDLTDLSAWARAVATAPSAPSGRRWGTYLCMADEGKIWAPSL